MAHQALGCTGLSRADLRWDDSQPGTDGLVVLELNTQPGMTPLSLAPEQAKWAGISWSAAHDLDGRPCEAAGMSGARSRQPKPGRRRGATTTAASEARRRSASPAGRSGASRCCWALPCCCWAWAAAAAGGPGSEGWLVEAQDQRR